MSIVSVNIVICQENLSGRYDNVTALNIVSSIKKACIDETVVVSLREYRKGEETKMTLQHLQVFTFLLGKKKQLTAFIYLKESKQDKNKTKNTTTKRGWSLSCCSWELPKVIFNERYFLEYLNFFKWVCLYHKPCYIIYFNGTSI